MFLFLSTVMRTRRWYNVHECLFFSWKKPDARIGDAAVKYTSRLPSDENSEENSEEDSDDDSETIKHVQDFPPEKLIQSSHASTLDLTVQKLSERIARKKSYETTNKCMLMPVKFHFIVFFFMKKMLQMTI